MSETPSRHAELAAAVRQAVFESDGCTPLEVRRAAGAGDPLPAPWGAYAAQVRDRSYQTTDTDIAALRAAGCPEEEIFEVTVAAAMGAAFRRFDAGLHAMRGQD